MYGLVCVGPKAKAVTSLEQVRPPSGLGGLLRQRGGCHLPLGHGH